MDKETLLSKLIYDLEKYKYFARNGRNANYIQHMNAEVERIEGEIAKIEEGLKDNYV